MAQHGLRTVALTRLLYAYMAARPASSRNWRPTHREKKMAAAARRKTLSNKREKTLKSGSVSSRLVVVALGDDGSEISDVRR